MPSDRLPKLSTLAAYLALPLWIGLRSARRIKTSDDQTLAGRGAGWVIVLATTPVTMVGGGTSVGMAAQVFEVGVAAALVTCAWHMQLIFTGLQGQLRQAAPRPSSGPRRPDLSPCSGPSAPRPCRGRE